MIKAVIIEDSRLARLELATLLKCYPQVQLLGEAASAQQGLKLIRQEKPDLIFLDIDLGGKNGFDLLIQLEEVPAIIFTTAFNQYALKSFEFNTIDYLLKPIVPLRFDQAIKKAQQFLTVNAIERSTDRIAGNEKIFIRDRGKTWLVMFKEIHLFESKGNYTQVFFNQHAPLILRSLKEVLASLDQQQFIKVNRQQIVNVDFIQDFLPSFNKGLDIRLKTGETISVSRRKISVFKKMFHL